MTVRAGVVVVALAAVALGAGSGHAQQKRADCDRAGTPEKVAGLVLKLDADGGKVTVREANGTIREFNASKETLQDLKVGDRVEATLRAIPNC
jgi:hypothetical protein